MKWGYRPALDGLRSIAVYLVLLFHTGLSWVGGGFIGVDLFFVLSGFLVSNVILSEIDLTGALRIGNFYARRVRRLLPAAVVVIVATCLVFLLVTSVVRRLPLVADAQSALLYVANWHFMSQSNDYFAANVDKSPFLHFWSLSIEEQFYLAFPIVLVVLTRAARRRPAVLAAGLATILVASLAAQLYWAQVDTSRAYYGTEARLYQLMAGALLAVALRELRPARPDRLGRIAAPVGVVGVLIVGSGLISVSPSVRGILATVVSVVLIGGLMLTDASIVSRALSRRVPVFLGRISYGTYLWHWPVILVLGEVLVIGPRAVAVMAMAIATGLAAVSYEVLEMPIRTATLLDKLRWTPAVIGVATSALIAATLVPWSLELDRRPALVALQSAQHGPFGVGPRAAGGPIQVPSDIDWSKVSRDAGKLGSCTADDVSACTLVDGQGPKVLVIGDSQAQMLVPMFEKLAKEHDLQLSINVRAGCMWQEGLTNYESSAAGRATCEEARVGWYDTVLPKIAPDIVILIQRARDDVKDWTGIVRRRDGTHQSLERMTYTTTNQTLTKLASLVPETVIVQNLVMPNTFDPDNCLTSTTDARRCAVPVPLENTPSDGFYQAAAARLPSVDTIDLSSAFCPSAPVCEPIVGGQPVWRDNHHYTASYAVSRRQEVWHLLDRAGLIKAAN